MCREIIFLYLLTHLHNKSPEHSGGFFLPMHRYFIIHKPFNVLSQFTNENGKLSLKDFFDVPSDVYPVGRLDYDSEGLLILTNDKRLNYQLLHPSRQHEKEYWVQVEGNVADKDLVPLLKGVEININGKKYKTLPAKASVLDAYETIPARNPPIRFRKSVPDTWIRVIITEGKNRQVRKMTASIGFPTLRLIRYRIERLTLDGLLSGEMRELSLGEIQSLLFSRRQM